MNEGSNEGGKEEYGDDVSGAMGEYRNMHAFIYAYTD